MRQCLLWILLLPLVGAQSSLQFDGRKVEATGSLSKGLSEVRALRLELRLHDFQVRVPSSQQVLIACEQFLAIQADSPYLRLTDHTNGGESHVHDLTNRKDVIIRIQHMVEQGQTLFEIWDADGRNYAVQKLPGRKAPANCGKEVVFGSNSRGEAYFNGSVAYFRWFDTTVPGGDPPSSTPEKALVAFEFEPNTTTVKGGPSLRVSGKPNYVKSPTYPPQVFIRNGNRTVSANEPVQLDATGSLAVGGAITNWQWEQVRGPVTAKLETANASNTTITGISAPGTYEFRLTVTDTLGQTARSSVQLGVVVADKYGVVQIPDPAMSFALGPLLRSGMSPWPYYEEVRNGMGRQWGETYPADPPGEKDYRAGKIRLTPGSKLVRGNGTAFLKDFLDAPVFEKTGTVAFTTGSNEIRGTGTQFFQKFLKDVRNGTGSIRLRPNEGTVEGVGSKFREQFEAGDYLVITTPGGGEQSLRIARVIDDRTLLLERPWKGAAMDPSTYRAAKPTGHLLVVEEAGGKLNYFAPNVQSNLLISVPGSVTTSGAGLRFGTAKADTFNHIIVHYPLEEPGKQGRLEFYFTSILSDTELLINPAYSGKALQDVTFGRAKGEELAYWQDGLNYYDSILVHYQNYYRTGLEIYRDYARRFADAWYTMFDSGRSPAESPLPPRMVGLNGLIVRALDGRPEMWPMIRRAARYNYNLWVGMRRDYPGFYYGIRDGGFSLKDVAILAGVDPDPRQRAEFLAMARDGAVNLYARLQRPDGSWRWEDSLWKGNGEQPFHVGLLLEGMVATHRLTKDPALQTAIVRSVDHLISIQEPAPCRSPVYAIYNDDGPWGQHCKEPNAKPSADEIKDGRAGNNTIMHAVGYAYSLTGMAKYKTAGDDMFSATFGNRQGPGADEYWGRAETSTKQYGQSFRTADAYLAYTHAPPGSFGAP